MIFKSLLSYSIIGGLGWLLAGPVGGVLGFVVATIIDSFGIRKTDRQKPIGVFSTNLLMLIAAVLKEKTPITDSETGFVKE